MFMFVVCNFAKGLISILHMVLKFTETCKYNPHFRRYTVIFLSTVASVYCYHRNNGPIIGAFVPQYVDPSLDCAEGHDHHCLVVPTKQICREKLQEMNCSDPYRSCYPLPWWYFYCHWVVTWWPSTTKTTPRTVAAYFKRELADFYKYKKGLTTHNNRLL